MKIVIQPRRFGKTEELVNKILSLPKDNVTNPALIVFSEAEKQRIVGIYPKIKEIIYTVEEVRNGKFIGHPSTRELFIDNADIILQNLFGWTINTISLTGDKIMVEQDHG